MTYDDPERTMTQHKIDMTFQELNPITENDYLDLDVMVMIQEVLVTNGKFQTSSRL